MKFSFDEKTGIYNLQISDKTIVDSELKQNLIIDYDENGKVIGIEILPFNAEEIALGHKLSKSQHSRENSNWLNNKPEIYTDANIL